MLIVVLTNFIICQVINRRKNVNKLENDDGHTCCICKPHTVHIVTRYHHRDSFLIMITTSVVSSKCTLFDAHTKTSLTK